MCPSVADTASPFLAIQSLSKRYGDQTALADVSFSVRAGEILGLIGPNGAGKTTLLEAIAGVLPADAGTILWDGAPLAQHQRRAFMFYVPDGVRPYASQYVSQVLSFFAGVYGCPRKQVATVIAAMGLGPVLAKRVQVLSKGYNRRLLLALGLLAPQPILLMDEPFDGFDLKQSRDMMVILRRVACAGRTLVLSIHQLGDAERICDRFVLLAGGTVRGTGTLEALRVKTGLSAASLEEVFLALT